MNRPNLQSNNHLYNPDWLSDDALVSGFVARQDEFVFLRGELANTPLNGSAQNYLLVGVRGAGKTTLLKRLAVAIRQEPELSNHLIALSFPEELYQIKDLADFWWACCEALADELDRQNNSNHADQLLNQIEKSKQTSGVDKKSNTTNTAGFELLQSTCQTLAKRPVLLVDNLDMVFQRIDKSGRKLKDPHAAAYWELREQLSTKTSPIVIGGSVRLSEPFTGYDKAFYDFFIPKRLSKLGIAEVRNVLERLADAQHEPEVKERLNERPSRLNTLYDLTGGNPRAIGLIFQLLRQSPGGKAVEDFERLMDITTPYYKARFEDLPEQGQVVMHALAVRRVSDANSSGLRFGHTAAEIAMHAGLATTSVSAQLDSMDKEGLIEKNSDHGRTQYRIAEQLFRLWLQMRGSRRVRQNVIGLTAFLEAMFSADELSASLSAPPNASPLSEARYAMAVSETSAGQSIRRGIEARSAEQVMQYMQSDGSDFQQYFAKEDLSEELHELQSLRGKLKRSTIHGLSANELEALIGAITLKNGDKERYAKALCEPNSVQETLTIVRDHLAIEQRNLLRYGLLEDDLVEFFHLRSFACLPLPYFTPKDVESALLVASNKNAFFALLWRIVGLRRIIKFKHEAVAEEWLVWGKKHANSANSTEWANVAGSMRLSNCLLAAEKALAIAFEKGESSRAWFDKAALFHAKKEDPHIIENLYRKAIELDPSYPMAWNNLGNLLAETKRPEQAEAAYRKAIDLDPNDAMVWRNLGMMLSESKRPEQAEATYQKAIELDPTYSAAWYNLGITLSETKRPEQAEAAYRKAIELDPTYAAAWNSLGITLSETKRPDQAEAAYQKAIELDPNDATAWYNLGIILSESKRPEKAEAAYQKAIELDPTYAAAWNNLGIILKETKRPEQAEAAYQKAIKLDPIDAMVWNNLGNILRETKRPDQAEAAYRKAIELDLSCATAWNNLGVLLNSENRQTEAVAAMKQAKALDENWHPYWRDQLLDVQTQIFTKAALSAVNENRETELTKLLLDFQIESEDISTAFVSQHFVENFLSTTLQKPTAARLVLNTLREMNADKFARPLLLAFEAAVENRPAMLEALEPELQRGTKRMYERLTGSGSIKS